MFNVLVGQKYVPDFSITFVMTFKRVQSAVDHLFQFASQPGLELAQCSRRKLCVCAYPVDDGMKTLSSSGTPFCFLMEIPFHSFC